jgi:predicted RNA-binding Zn ribbon-like protein
MQVRVSVRDVSSPPIPQTVADLVTESFAVVLPDEPLPVRLMNTIWADRHGVHDALVTTANLRTWLAATTAPPEPDPNSDDLARFRTLRDALRRLAATLTGDTRPAAASATTDVDRAVADVNDAAQQAPTWPQLTLRDGDLIRTTNLGSATPYTLALSTIAHDAIDLLTGDDRLRLRACHAPGCVLYFVKGHPRREWCSTACGNRVRAARHYERHRTAS